MGNLRVFSRLFAYRVLLCTALGLMGLCHTARPARAQQTGGETAVVTTGETPTGAPAEIEATASIRTTDDEPGGPNVRRRLPLERMLRDVLFGIAWDRTRLPMRASLYGNEEKTFTVQMSLSRRNFNGVTLRLKF